MNSLELKIAKMAEYDKTAKAVVEFGVFEAIKLFSERLVIEESGCWNLGVKPDKNGYSQKHLHVNGKQHRTYGHRISWIISGRNIVPGFVLDHSCRNRRCVNPFHLRQISRGENIVIDGSESIAAINKCKSHCKNGHEFTEQNIRYKYFGKYIKRACRECERLSGARQREKKRNGSK